MEHATMDLATELADRLNDNSRGSRARAQWVLSAAFAELDELSFAVFVQDVLALTDRREKLGWILIRTTGQSLAKWIPTPQDHWVPTQQEIARECRRIRAGWTDSERKSRWTTPTRWEVPTVRSRRTAR